MKLENGDYKASPRGVLEACLTFSGSDSPSPEEKNDENVRVACMAWKPFSTWTKFFKLFKTRSIRCLATLSPLTLTKMSKAKHGNEKEGFPAILDEIYKLKSSLEQFSFSELSAATISFSSDNVIGKGGYAIVYRGLLPDGRYVAIKKLMKGSSDERILSFLSEFGIVAHVNHPNIAKLIGFGVEGGMHLVFQLSPLGSLGSILHGSGLQVKLDWSKRYKIALGIANGLVYLHESCRKRIIHRDIKTDNILLTEDFEPQICDFGLAKWLPEQWTHRKVSYFEGTFGYFSPEYFKHGVVDEKTDVYAFGVLLLELITGRKARPFFDDNAFAEIVDPALGNEYDPEDMERLIMTASLCVEQSPVLRPRMRQVIVLMKGNDTAAAPKGKEICPRTRRSVRGTYSEELLDARETYKSNSTRCSSDLGRCRS